MKRKIRFRKGDKVKWPSSPGELSCNRFGTITSIKNGVATIWNSWMERESKVPIKILQKDYEYTKS